MGPDDATRLRDAWHGALRALGAEPVPRDTEDLLARWSEPHRTHHDVVHAGAVVASVRRLAPVAGLSERGTAVALLAAAAHDVVHDGRAGEDEEASARWLAAAGSRAGVPAADLEQAVAAVRATARHTCDADGEGASDAVTAVVLDADLDVLAAPAPAYDAYVARVRAEYAQVVEEDWRRGRAAVLRGLLARERLFLVDEAHGDGGRAREDAARANLARELAALDVGAGGAAGGT